ncbi:centrosomal protein of 55 kDa-like [Nerophis lumbriciformis]|uniref:centrosomal protein of 55 kDa-like n=1 Tax=Nerophis lumbriciformis TaxID=546530 RepID=UPI002AE07467|nr:centrosomal protein of 55 kDa-like [Nerophis lumbriciformis]XP_061796259.1 centrosomal protein of 55 kDa-like [Nerophis lumbriciformis]
MSSCKMYSTPGRRILLKNKFTILCDPKGNASHEQASSSDAAELQKKLDEALAKNHHWHVYDQQREAYVRAVVNKMTWLKKKLDETTQAQSKQHNKDLSEGNRDSLSDFIDYFESSLAKDQVKLAILEQQLDEAHEDFAQANDRCVEKECEVNDLKQKLEGYHHRCEENEQYINELQSKMDEDRLQFSIFRRCMVDRYHADQEKIENLQRQVRISSQELEDEVQESSYLKKQMNRFRNVMRRTLTKKSTKRKQHKAVYEGDEDDVVTPCLSATSESSIADGSFLSCPLCWIQYPVSQYEELLNHVDVCLA